MEKGRKNLIKFGKRKKERKKERKKKERKKERKTPKYDKPPLILYLIESTFKSVTLKVNMETNNSSYLYSVHLPSSIVS